MGNRNDPSAGVLCSPPGCHVRCGTTVSTLCVLTARARCPGAVCLHRLARTRATTHTCGHRGPTSCFSASLMCLLGLRVVCMEFSPLKLPYNRLFVEAPQERRSGKTSRGLLDAFWVWVCILQLQGKHTKAAQIPDPQGQQDQRLHHFGDKLSPPKSCSTPCNSEVYKDINSCGGITVLWGQVSEPVWTRLPCVPPELPWCLLSPCLHAIPIPRSHPRSWGGLSAGVVQCLGKRRLIPLKAEVSSSRDGKLCSMGSFCTAAYSASFLSASLSQILFKNSGILACIRGALLPVQPENAGNISFIPVSISHL